VLFHVKKKKISFRVKSYIIPMTILPVFHLAGRNKTIFFTAFRTHDVTST